MHTTTTIPESGRSAREFIPKIKRWARKRVIILEPPSGRQDSAALLPAAEEDRRQTEQVEAGERERGHGRHGG